PPCPTLLPSTTLFRSLISLHQSLLMFPTGPGSPPLAVREIERQLCSWKIRTSTKAWARRGARRGLSKAPLVDASRHSSSSNWARSEEHTSELQSPDHL